MSARIARLLPGMLNPSRQTDQVSTPPPRIVDLLPEWRTRDDSVLFDMAENACELVGEICGKAAPRWLTLWGPPGVGKTFLARLIHRSFPKSSRWLDWVDLCRRYQAREDTAGRLARATEAKLLIIDDIGAEHMTLATIGMLHGLLNARLGQWTVITTNHSPDTWQEKDDRISSRLIRGGNKHVSCHTADYATR